MNRLIAVAAALTLVPAASAETVPPPALRLEAAFSVEKGRLVIQGRQNKAPVKDARVRVLDFAGQTIADGECDDDGRGSFPLPGDEEFLVGVTVPGKKEEADLLTLRRHGKREVLPPRVSLSFSKPCCRV